MTRGELITRTLRLVGDTSLTDQARDALDDIFLKIESIGYWEYLQNSTTYATVNVIDSVTLAGLSITDYSKGMWASSSSKPYKLDRISHEAMKELQGDGATGAPGEMSMLSDTVFLYPQPVTGDLPTLTFHWFKQTSLPTDDGDELSTTPGIPKKYHSFLIDGVAATLLLQQDDTNSQLFIQSFLAGVSIMILDNADFTPDAGKRVDEEVLKALFFGGKV